jgi:hypothetical protein
MNRIATNMAKPVTCVAAISVLIAFSGCNPGLTDISPDRSNGVSDGGNSTAGLVINMAGDQHGLYAVGLNSGVWKTQADGAGFLNSKWIQLPQSPRYAHCIAVDPNAPDHIAVGEREGDALNVSDNNCGLWESYDGGKTFDPKYYFNPLTHSCGNHVVNAVVITNASTILISTPCGIGRKAPFDSTFSFDATISTQSFTGISAFDDWIVARTRTEIFISNDDGKTWDRHPIQLSFPSQQPAVPPQNFSLGYIGERGGNYSVCVIKIPQTNNIFVYVPVTRNPNNPGNYGSCVIFNNQTKTWTFQIIQQAGLGIVNGGRVFMKSFLLRNQNLQNIVGGTTNLIYCAADDLVKASQINSDGTAVWESVAQVPGTSNFHTDIWDFLIDPSGWYAWVSCDGGVYYYAMDTIQTTVALNSSSQYLNLNHGLHTQHVHEAFVAGYLGDTPRQEHYGFGCQDNGGWQNVTTKNVSNWTAIPGTTDVNIIEGDQGNPNLMLAARNLQSAVLAGLLDFGDSALYGAKLGPIAIAYNGNSFQFIQTMASENEPPFLDAVMLTTLPLQYAKAPASETDIMLTNVPSDLGLKSGSAIIRNTAFAVNPDINLSMGAGWSMEFNDLPKGAKAFWVSGGHVDPTYYLLCQQRKARVLYKRQKSENSWTQLTGLDNVTILPYTAGEVQHGPVFVNPYDPNMIYVSCTDGIYHSVKSVRTPRQKRDSGDLKFERDVELTNLVSGNGKYPIDRTFPGGNDINVSHSNQSSLNAMYPVSWVSFNRFKPEQVVASSPFTGVFFKDGTNKWRDLSAVLPKPFTPVSSVNINNQGIYVTTEGRGMLEINNY